jgi:UDP-sulfoquinovose synthase
MKLIVLGADGYIGSEFMYRNDIHHDIIVVDNYYKRTLLGEEKITPLYDVPYIHDRDWRCKKSFIDITDSSAVDRLIKNFKPDAILHLGEQPSAPWSMNGAGKATRTIDNNLNGTLNIIFSVLAHAPDAHIIKIGSMGEYGTPNVIIPEGWFDLDYRGRQDRLLFPKNPHSIYHLSKVFESDALAFACKTWGLKVTDLNQGFVYGTTSEARSRYCYDAMFGTSINRFIAQAVAGIPLTVYGKGGQTRGLIHISDSIKCLELALQNTPTAGQFVVANQLTEWKTINDIAAMVVGAAEQMAITATIEPIDNPRTEQEEHFYQADHSVMQDYGLRAIPINLALLMEQIDLVRFYKDNIKKELIFPMVKWSKRG